MKLVFFAFLIFMILARNLQYTDPNCNSYDSSNNCLQCSYRYYKNSQTGLCTKISDNCQTWSDTNGNCLTCYYGYGNPLNGVCNGDVVITDDINCGEYGYILDKKWVTPDTMGAKKTCKTCKSGYFLDATNICQALPKNCINVNANKICTICNKGYYLNSLSICQALPENCLNANSSTNLCTSCSTAYVLSNNSCIIDMCD